MRFRPLSHWNQWMNCLQGVAAVAVAVAIAVPLGCFVVAVEFVFFFSWHVGRSFVSLCWRPLPFAELVFLPRRPHGIVG